eukprot:symbB.v1.2.025088.t1/scaffold2313.1/size127079/9
MVAASRWSFLILSLLFSSFLDLGFSSDEVDPDDEDEDDDFPESVSALKSSTFDSFLKEHERTLVEFYAPWCGHCQKLEPEYNQAADALRMEGAKTVLAKVDATAEPDLASKYEVTSYPTLKYFVNGGDPIEYDGPRDADGIAEWLRKREKPAVEEIEVSGVDSFIQKGLESNSYVVVAHVKKKSARAKALFKAADSLVDYKASKLRLKASMLGKDAVMAMSRPSDPDPEKIDFSGSWTDGAITKWLKQSTYAAVGKDFKPEKYGLEAVQEVGSKGSVVGIYGDDEAGKTLRELFNKAASQHKDWRFTTVSKSSIEDLDMLGVRGEVTMQITVLHEKKYVLKEGINEEALKNLLADVLAKKAKPYYKSAVAAEATENGVTILTGASVLKLYHKIRTKFGSWQVTTLSRLQWIPKKMFLLNFMHLGQKLAPVWSELAKKVEKKGYAKKGVVVAKMDATENECEEQITSYPQLILYPAVKKEKKMRQKLAFSGHRDSVDVLMDFLVEGAVNLEDVEDSVEKQPSLVERERAKKKKKEL